MSTADDHAYRLQVAAALALGAGVSWNISNVGAVADVVADDYGVSLATVGLFTTALFVTHLAAQIPAGKTADARGARLVGLIALAAVAVGNGLLLLAADPALAVAARALVGIGSGAGFVAGSELIRAARPSRFLQGVYGGVALAGGGLAVATVPLLTEEFRWRAPYLSALAVVAVAAVVVAAAPGQRRPEKPAAAPLLADRSLLPLGALQAATFGLSVVLANWVTTLLQRDGHDSEIAGALGSLTLLAGILTRPLGAWALTRFPAATRQVVGAALVAAAAGALVLAAPLPLALRGVGAAALGLAAGLPFATVITAAQAIRPDAPAAAIGLVNSVGVAAIVVGTPLVGLSFSLPGDGRIGFLAAAALIAAALAAVRAVPDEP